MAMTFKNLTVLIVEDLAPVTELLSEALRRLGVGEILSASNGKDGLRITQREVPDIILTDWQMPIMDGLEMTREIRKQSLALVRTIPIIMMTGFSAQDRIVESLESGVNSFLVKPFSAKDMSRRMSHVINNPVDFVITEHYVGPERPDMVAGIPESNIIRIKANQDLQRKAGIGAVEESAIDRAQKVIDQNKIDFLPIAAKFIEETQQAIDQMRQEQEPTRKSIERVIAPIMQVKANARIFKQDLMGNLSDIMLDFLERVNQPDEAVYMIVDAHQQTLWHILKNKERDGGKDTELEDELSGACRRYMNIRIGMQKSKLERTAKS